MTIEFIWPQTTGELLAWLAAVVVLLSGLLAFFMPGTWLRLVSAESHDASAYRAIVRSLGGLKFGIGLAVLMLHPQPLLYLALGFGLAFAAIAGLISLFADHGDKWRTIMLLLGHGLLAGFAIAYSFGFIA